jgi:hypothetical protein
MPFKIYADSRFRQETGGSSSDSEFSIELPHPIQVKGKAFVDTILIPNSFYVIRAGENDRFHVREDASTFRVCTIAEGQFNAITLKDALLTALNTGRSMTGQYTVTYDTIRNKLIIGNLDATATFHVYPTAWLKANANTWNTASFAAGGPLIDAKNLMDAGSVTGFATGAAILSGNVNSSVSANDVVNLLPYHQLFLRSSLGTGYDAIGPDGSSDIIRRITCQVGLNDLIVDQHSLPHDSVTIGDKQISSLSFRLTDCFGKTVDTKGHHISFSIIFLEDD